MKQMLQHLLMRAATLLQDISISLHFLCVTARGPGEDVLHLVDVLLMLFKVGCLINNAVGEK